MSYPSPTIGNSIHPNLVAFTQKFIEIPPSWLPKIAGHSVPLPMWNTLFLVNNPEHHAIINALLRDLDDEDGNELSDHWFAVAETGFLACEVDDRIFLGIDGAGYCFYKAHWEPLFKLIFS